MRGKFEDDLSDSAFDFQRVVLPVILKKLGGGEVRPVESETDSILANDFDTLAGIDAWQIHREGGYMRGIASRVQWLPENGSTFDTFTVRKSRDSGASTEYEKRLMAIEKSDHGYLYPHLTVQAYIARPARMGRLMSCGMVRTVDLFKALKDLIAQPAPQRIGWGLRRTSNAEFVWIKWDALQRRQIEVFIARHIEIEQPIGKCKKCDGEGCIWCEQSARDERANRKAIRREFWREWDSRGTDD